MTALLTELKTRARLRLNAVRRPAGREAAAGELRLRDCLNDVARDVGFAHWEHARHVLGALAASGEDMGSFWHAPGCNVLLNTWHASYADALGSLVAKNVAFLLPYRRQFVVVGEPFLRELGLDPADPAWADAGRDLVRAYGGAAWRELARQRLKAPRSSFASR